MPHALIRLALAVSLVGTTPWARADEPVDEPKKPVRQAMRFIDQGHTDKRLSGMRTPEGIRLEVAAEKPAVVNPVALTFSETGTPFVIDHPDRSADGRREQEIKVTYKDGSTRSFPSQANKSPDVIKVLIASRPGGPWDGSRVVLEVNQAAGLLHHGGWLYVAGGGSVRRFKESKPGGKLDVQQVVARGFCADGPRQVSGLAVGPDGWLYLSAGAGDHFAEGSDGGRATVLRSGAVFRCRPDGSKLHVFALGFRNPYQNPTFDLAGHLFHADGGPAETGKASGSRLMQVPEGADFGYRLLHGSRHEADPDRGTLSSHRPGTMAPLVATRSRSSAGALIFNDTCFPESIRGLLLQPDPDGRAVRAWRITQAGASFSLTPGFDLVSAAKGPPFRPRQLLVGPDGALYLVDERRPPGGVSRAGGRIYRLRWSGTADLPAVPLRGLDSWKKVVEGADRDLIGALSSEDASVRAAAGAEVVRRGARNRRALLDLLADEEASALARIQAVGTLQGMYDADVQKAFLKVLDEGEDELRRLVAEALGWCARRADRDVHNALLQVASADDHDLRRSVVLSLGRLAGPGAADNLATALSFDDGKDPALSDGLVRAIEMLGKPGIDALLSVADSGAQKGIDRVAATFLGLRIRPALQAIPTLLRNPHLSSAQRAALVTSCANYVLDPPASLDPIVSAVAANAGETTAVRRALLQVVSAPGVQTGDRASAFVLAELASTDSGVRLAAAAAAGKVRLGAKGKEVAAAVRRLLADRSAELKRVALRSLATLDPAAAAVEARGCLAVADEALQAQAVAVLGGTAEGAILVGKRWLAGKLPRSLRPAVAAALSRHAAADAESALLLADLEKEPSKP